MSKITLVKSANGSLIPFSEEDQEKLRKFKTGSALGCEIAQMRNPQYHRKFFSLVKFLYDIWSEAVPPATYRGVEVKPSIERFRKDLIILTGRFTAHYNIRGEVRVEADSISFAKMSQEEFEKLFSEVIDIGLSKVINRPDLTQEKVRRLVDQLIQYD